MYNSDTMIVQLILCTQLEKKKKKENVEKYNQEAENIF